MISGARKAKYLNVITMFPHSQGNTPLGPSECARRFWGHGLRPEVTRASLNILHMCLRPWGQVPRTPYLKFKIEREILVLESSRLGKNYLVISDMVVKFLACFLSHFLRLNFLKCPCGVHVLAIRKYRTSESSVSWRVINPKVTRVFIFLSELYGSKMVFGST